MKNLCSSQKYHKIELVLTFTCNQKEYYSIYFIRLWIDNKEWQRYYKGFHIFFNHEKKERNHAIEQASAGLLLRWMEVRNLF